MTKLHEGFELLEKELPPEHEFKDSRMQFECLSFKYLNYCKVIYYDCTPLLQPL